MRWFDWLLRRYRNVEDLRDVGLGRVEIEGVVESVDTFTNPVDGDSAVAAEYRAYPPSTTVGVDGGTAHNSRAFQVSARQAVDFILSDGRARVLVRVAPGDDLTRLHDGLVARYGVGLRAEVDSIGPGARVRVAGRVLPAPPGSPHRTEPYSIVRADRFWPIASDA